MGGTRRDGPTRRGSSGRSVPLLTPSVLTARACRAPCVPVYKPSRRQKIANAHYSPDFRRCHSSRALPEVSRRPIPTHLRTHLCICERRCETACPCPWPATISQFPLAQLGVS
jgi:hypothetical protein